jgi:hypothetical protein
MKQEMKHSLIGLGLMLSVVFRVAAVLLAVRYVGLSYDLADAYNDMLRLVQWIMPDLLWCVLWFFALPLVEARLVDWLEDEQADSPLIVSGVSTADERQK